MDYFRTKQEALNNMPDARWVYVDAKGIGGSHRWYASKRLLKEVVKRLAKEGTKPNELRTEKKCNYPIEIELF